MQLKMETQSLKFPSPGNNIGDGPEGPEIKIFSEILLTYNHKGK